MHKLTIKNLSKTYPNGVKALVDVNLEDRKYNQATESNGTLFNKCIFNTSKRLRNT